MRKCMSVKVVVFLEVEDFEVFSNTFNSDGAKNARQEAGIEAVIYQGLDNPNQSVGIATAPSKEEFAAFFASPAQQERMQSAGVQGPPIITFLKD